MSTRKIVFALIGSFFTLGATAPGCETEADICVHQPPGWDYQISEDGGNTLRDMPWDDEKQSYCAALAVTPGLEQSPAIYYDDHYVGNVLDRGIETTLFYAGSSKKLGYIEADGGRPFTIVNGEIVTKGPEEWTAEPYDRRIAIGGQVTALTLFFELPYTFCRGSYMVTTTGDIATTTEEWSRELLESGTCHFETKVGVVGTGYRRFDITFNTTSIGSDAVVFVKGFNDARPVAVPPTSQTGSTFHFTQDVLLRTTPGAI